MFRNLKVFWKFAIVAFLIPVAVLVTAGSALVSTTSLKTEYDHLYGESLAPILLLNDGHIAIKTLMDDVFKLTRRGLPTDEFKILAEKARVDEKKLLAAYKRYETDFASTRLPEFGPMLSGMGRLYLQTAEVKMMNQFKTAYQGYESQREMLLAGQIPDYAWMEGYLSQMEIALSTLAAINRNYAEISNQRAQQVIGQMRAVTIVLALVACLVASIITIAISRDVTVPLEKAVRTIIEMGQGHLGNRLQLKRKDEIGVLADTMDTFAEDLQNNVIGSLSQIASGNLDIEIAPKDSRDEISPALLKTVESLRALNMATDFADCIARGEIPQPITAEYRGSFEVLKNNLNTLSERLREMLVQLSSSANNLSASANEILASTTQQAAGASEQSAAISQTTATVEQVRAITEHASARIQEVANASQRTVNVARAGRDSIEDTIESMEQIKKQVEGISANIRALAKQIQQISEIITTVNDIAAQSNMLALNAAVEAARAGENGMGFAVVAGEVRSLAEQSRQATVQIKSLLSEIQKATKSTVIATEEGIRGVDQGVQRTAQTRQAIEQLTRVIDESAEIAAQVVSSGQQQIVGIEQVVSAMQQINLATIQNLVSTRQAEHSAQALNELATSMAETVAGYKLN